MSENNKDFKVTYFFRNKDKNEVYFSKQEIDNNVHADAFSRLQAFHECYFYEVKAIAFQYLKLNDFL